MKKEQIENELKLLKNPKINKNANLKFNINPKNLTTVERLYDQDIKKRKDNKVILTKIYTPSFHPTIYTKRDLIQIAPQNESSKKTENLLRTSQMKKQKDEEEEEEEIKIDRDMDSYQARKIRTKKNHKHKKKDDHDNALTNRPKKKKSKKVKKNKSAEKKRHKMKIQDEDKDSDDDENENKNADDIEEEKIELTLRNRLFRNMKPIRSNSVGQRKKY